MFSHLFVDLDCCEADSRFGSLLFPLLIENKPNFNSYYLLLSLSRKTLKLLYEHVKERQSFWDP